MDLNRNLDNINHKHQQMERREKKGPYQEPKTIRKLGIELQTLNFNKDPNTQQVTSISH